MDENLLAAYRAAAYRVRLRQGGWATIRIDAPLPTALVAVAGERPWGFITAWNPHSQVRSSGWNRKVQHRLLITLRDLPSTQRVCAGVGTGMGWKEPSLFVIGPDTASLDTVARNFEQNAYVHGYRDGIALLRLL
ncbi:DUF3293 domain-containing protein [Dyella koreensis]|uniref:DUF3293 domain-containing protein n=1 Tax=Dyella koreensis TaxID=311235 RepID=A0ABW8KBP1_9GAMM